MAIRYPIYFNATATTESGISTPWSSESVDANDQVRLHDTLLCAVPKAFEGPGGGLSPEDFFLQALMNCFVATFKVYAAYSQLEYKKLSVSSDLTVDLGDDRKPFMKACSLGVRLEGPSNMDKAKAVAEKAFKSGFILNSVKTELKMELSFS